MGREPEDDTVHAAYVINCSVYALHHPVQVDALVAHTSAFSSRRVHRESWSKSVCIPRREKPRILRRLRALYVTGEIGETDLERSTYARARLRCAVHMTELAERRRVGKERAGLAAAVLPSNDGSTKASACCDKGKSFCSNQMIYQSVLEYKTFPLSLVALLVGDVSENRTVLKDAHGVEHGLRRVAQ